MTKYFIPYSDENPASIDVKGHKLVVICTEKDDVHQGMNIFGADRIEEIEVDESEEVHELFLSNLAKRIRGGVVVVPPGVDIDQVVEGLEMELPWIQ